MACPYCFGGEDTLMRDSLTAGLSVMVGITLIVLGCFARFFISLARRSREAAHLVGGGPSDREIKEITETDPHPALGESILDR